MTHHADVARGRDILARWCKLAEQRLEHLTELFETGRWRRYHNEVAFLENIQEAKAAVEIWRNLELREASLDNAAIDLSWLGRRRPAPLPGDRLREPVQLRRSQPAAVAAEPALRETAGDVSIVLATRRIDPDPVPSVADAPVLDDSSAVTLDLDVIQRRYPLLHNAL